jgi:hypoxanthine phosphoribosyltransferase
MELDRRRLKLLLSDRAIQRRVRAMGAEISRDYRGESVHFVGVLKGAVFFLSDLIRSVRLEASVDFMAVTSYGKGTRSSGRMKLIMDLDCRIEGRNVILVEDILDTGRTSRYLIQELNRRSPKTLRLAVLLDKSGRRVQPVHADYVGFRIPDRFVVGYGLDHGQRYRHLRDVYVLQLPRRGPSRSAG